MAKEIKQWITVNHVHIPIFEGETAKDAVKRMKEGLKKGKSTRPIPKEEYEKKAKAADKAHKAIGSHTERLLNADKRIKEGDTSDEAKKEFMNAERTLKEAGQRFQKRSAEHQEAAKHPKYTSIKVRRKEKPVESKETDNMDSYRDKVGNSIRYGQREISKSLKDIPEGTKMKLRINGRPKEFIRAKVGNRMGWSGVGSEKDRKYTDMIMAGDILRSSKFYSTLNNFYEDNFKLSKPKAKSPSLDNITDAKNQAELNSKLKERGLSLDSAYQKAHSDDRVTMYDKDGNSYTGTYNQYNDGGREIVNIRKEKSWQDKDAEVKAKQIANAEAQKAERNEDFVVDYDLSKLGDDYWKKQEKKRISREIADENDALEKKAQEYKPRYYTNMDLEDEQFRKDALAEMKRYQRNWEFYDAKERRNISPNGYKELEARIKEIEDYEKNLKRKGEEGKGFHSTYTHDMLGHKQNDHQYRVSNNNDIKSAIEDASKRIFENEENAQHAMQLKYDNMEGFYHRGSPLVTRSKYGWNLSPDDTGGARKALIQAHYEVTGETKKPGNKFNYKDKNIAKKVFEKSSYIMSQMEEKNLNKGKNGEPKLEYDLGGNLLGKDGKLAKNMSKQELEDWQKEVEKKSEKVVDFGNGEAIKKRNESIIEYNGVKMPRKDADDINYLKKELSFLSERAAHLKVHMGKTLSEKELKEREDLQNQLRKYKKKYPNISIGHYLPGGK